MIEDSGVRSGEQYIKDVLSNIVNRIPIGPSYNRVGVTLFDYSMYPKIHMSRDQDAQTLTTNIRNMRFHHYTNTIDYAELATKISEYTNSHKDGDRVGVPDVIVVFSDHAQSSTSSSSMWSHGRRRRWGSHGSDSSSATNPVTLYDSKVIVVNIGNIASSSYIFSRLASSESHVMNVQDYQHLHDLESSIVNMICP